MIKGVVRRPVSFRTRASAHLAAAALLLLVGAACGAPRGMGETASSAMTPTMRPTATPEPLVPTPTGAALEVEVSSKDATEPSATPSPTLMPTGTPILTRERVAATEAAPKPTATTITSRPHSASPTLPPSATPTVTPDQVTATETGSESTATATASPPPSPSATSPASATPGATSTNAPTIPPAVAVPVPQGRARFGAGVVSGPISAYPVEASGLRLGWYLNWGVRTHPAHPGGAAFWQMIRVSEGGYRPDAAAIRAAASANPGSFWIIGNEPDVRWQDNVTPERYAELYHELYHLLKETDPDCHVVIGGVSQPTPLRMAYLERVLGAYQARHGAMMPVDVWNVHAFILREERDSWGVDIPPGIGANTGMLYEIDDHDDLAIFRSQLYAFRRWMADHGYRDKPLAVTEYGILMPSDYGFGVSETRVFMEGSFDVFLTVSDGAVGYPPDGNRLVQWWCWYSLAAPEDYYPTGNLFDPATKALTPLGASFAAYGGP